MSQATYEKLRALRLPAMADTYLQIMDDPKMQSLSFTELMGIMTDAEWAQRKANRLRRLILRAGFDQPNAHIADIDYAPARELNRELILRLASCDYLQDARNIVVMGATGTGKSYLACALGMEACKQSYTVRYTRMTELFEELILARSEGKFLKFKKDIAKVDLLIIDDWMLVKLTEEESTMLLEVIHSRHRRKSTMFCSQFAPPGWHLRIPEEIIADAILDRIVYDSYEIHLKSSTESPSMRQKYAFTP